MTIPFILIYLITIPGLCIVLGFIMGKKHGYDLGSQHKTWQDLKTSLFIIQSLKQTRSDSPTLEEQLKKAIENEDFEVAAKLRDQLNNDN